MPYSNQVKPVALPAGRARLATNPALTGSTTATNTIGIVRVACCNAPTIGLPIARMTSGVSATNSATFLRMTDAAVIFQIVRGWTQEHSDALHQLGLLRARREGPRRRAAKQRDELAPS